MHKKLKFLSKLRVLHKNSIFFSKISICFSKILIFFSKISIFIRNISFNRIFDFSLEFRFWPKKKISYKNQYIGHLTKITLKYKPFPPYFKTQCKLALQMRLFVFNKYCYNLAPGRILPTSTLRGISSANAEQRISW